MKEQIKKIIGKVMDDESIVVQLSDDTNIITDVGLDSLQMIEFMLEIEEEFGIEIEFDTLDISHLYSIKSFAEFLSTQRNMG